MIDITTERFFGGKASTVVGGGVVKQQALGEFEWQLCDITLDDGQTQMYQVVVGDAARDVLHTPAGANAYVAHMDTLGEVHGTLQHGEATPMGAEQSNTSLIVGETIVKVFRKLERGLNPDVELLSQIENPHVAAVTGYVTLGEMTLAMQQERIDGADGFALATAGMAPKRAGDLGAAIRSVHASLAETFGTVEVAAHDVRDTLNANLADYVRRAPVLQEYAEAISELYSAAFAGSSGGAEGGALQSMPTQRVHGDLHLGQTLQSRTADQRWYLIDFEGEPARPLADRRRRDHPLRDVAGMVRSFGYAREVGRLDAQWESDAVSQLLTGYGDIDATLLKAYVADKAAYEVVYEANNRPDWVEIPLRAIRQLTGAIS